MNTIGIIAEYNPFHNGHKYQIEEAKRLTGAKHVVVLMSGNYVQRGAPAIIDKFSRAKMALVSGADIVLELPLGYAIASAEAFAFGAVSIFQRLGFIDGICFGCETPSLALLENVAELFWEEPASFKADLVRFQKDGLSYPAARQQAALNYFKKTEATAQDLRNYEELLTKPNNILALEYVKAIKRLRFSTRIVPIQRVGNMYHDTNLGSKGTFSSATALRASYMQDKLPENLSAYMPKDAISILKQQERKTFPVDIDDFSTLLYYKLLQEQDLTQYADVTTDFANKLKKNIAINQSFTQYIEALKSKNMVYSRISRNLLHILLGITPADTKGQPEYVRLLGLNKSASFLLKNTTDVTIITKVANAKKQLSIDGITRFQKELNANALYQKICYDKFGHIGNTEYQQRAIITS